MHPVIRQHLELRPKITDKSRRATIYHYTNLFGLFGILSTKEIWATNIHYLNDTHEFQHAIRLFNAISRDIMSRSESNSLLLKSIAAKVEGIKNLNVFVASFSENDDLLSQWRSYCPQGGASVGFLYDHLHATAYVQGFSIVKCIYDSDEKRRLMNALISQAIERSRSGREEEIVTKFIKQFAIIAACFKDESFQEEQEWRLASGPISVRDAQVDFRVSETMIRPFFRLRLEQEGCKHERDANCGIDQILIGPHNHQELLVDAVGSMVTNRRLQWREMGQSVIPYRTL